MRVAPGSVAIYTMPSLGGQERKLVDLQGPARRSDYSFIPVLSWSPDGQYLVYAGKAPSGPSARVLRLSLSSSSVVTLTSPPEESLGDFNPEVSPDGRRLAFVRSGTRGWGNHGPVGSAADRR